MLKKLQQNTIFNATFPPFKMIEDWKPDTKISEMAEEQKRNTKISEMAEEQKPTTKVLVAAIDFGTTYSGYAFSFKDEYLMDPTRIMTNTTWVAGHKNLFSQKTPTCILLKPDKSFHSFGYEAEDAYTDLANEGKHRPWYFFRRFKMMLHDNMVSNK